MGNNNNIISLNDYRLGIFGEKYVEMKLSSLGIGCINLQNNFDFDIYTDNDLRIEVKISRIKLGTFKCKKGGKVYIYNKEYWSFNNHALKEKKLIKRDRMCDFFILICLDKNDIFSYIIPKGILLDKRNVFIYKNAISPIYSKYKDKWDLLI